MLHLNTLLLHEPDSSQLGWVSLKFDSSIGVYIKKNVKIVHHYKTTIMIRPGNNKVYNIPK